MWGFWCYENYDNLGPRKHRRLLFLVIMIISMNTGIFSATGNPRVELMGLIGGFVCGSVLGFYWLKDSRYKV